MREVEANTWDRREEQAGGLRRDSASDTLGKSPRGGVAQEEAHLLQEHRQQDDGQAGRDEEEPQLVFNG
ncbi:hypothetical protein EYF80_061413 [Liparis tanakae]|uniref:Uncharacterized protein n=1 Tax=Liparis tanakae TaxID=230148 RepID=A0A4Z2EIQ1_9TELE|nr:hypothetical protein EYF80_061413 [Liparis tanakae]